MELLILIGGVYALYQVAYSIGVHLDDREVNKK